MTNENGRHGPEHLRVYRIALLLGDQVDELLRAARCDLSLANQLRRAVDSTVLNIAEGSAHFSPGRKIYFYQTAHGSATECVGAITRLRRRNPGLDLRRPVQTAQMVSAMLVALIHTQQNRQTPPLPPTTRTPNQTRRRSGRPRQEQDHD